MNGLSLSDAEFDLFRTMIYDAAGINMSPAKKALVAGRLAKRVSHYSLATFNDYFKVVKANTNGEFQIAIDLLTTNETFFFREIKHFDFLRTRVLPGWVSGEKKIWSAASSSGEEAYSLAMTMAESCPTPSWKIVGTDISTRIIKSAQTAQYPMARSKDIPLDYLKKYCLKGIGPQDGTFIIGPELKSRVSFQHANLTQNLTAIGSFDVIFLRNVMIYFDMEIKKKVVSAILRQLNPGGYLMIGHSESLNGVTDEVNAIAPSIYQKPRP
ncbi:MAG TPA: SAM-dependent methyltransferase [Oceanospirillales bacterium]|nr:SAM-dependent methyltransferase [Oceanospirillaceae bacterium]HBS41909.1 SAM-dependent methyltransferase [Oceanospirillales bacterium]|tara:strand:+ start:4976 stop:5782 length:807 start_codon:yes stop_codon:yes gene_type:complete